MLCRRRFVWDEEVGLDRLEGGAQSNPLCLSSSLLRFRLFGILSRRGKTYATYPFKI